MTEKKQIKITPAKGRPMLTWVGKHPLSQVTAFPAQHVETFHPGSAPILGADRQECLSHYWADWPDRYPRGGLLFHGDNKEVLAHLLANGFRGKVKLIYIDPPFDSGADYVRRVRLRGPTGSTQIEGEGYTLGEQIQYTDIWANDNYLQFMYERLLLLRELLAEDGSIFLHCDWHKSHHLRCLMDEVFGPEWFRNILVWKRKGGSANPSGQFDNMADFLLWYVNGDDYHFEALYNRDHPDTQNYINERFTEADEFGRRFMKSPIVSPHPRPKLKYEYKGYKPPENGWSISVEVMREWDRLGKLWFPPDKSQRIYRKIYLDEYPGQPIHNLWLDVFVINPMALERIGFPTQKPEALLDRIIRVSSNPGDLVLDCFVGSGTTAAVAQRLGRRWIGCDINKGAVQTTSKRLQTIIQEQIAAQNNNSQEKLVESDDTPPEPAQLSFTVWRVNDYDLQIQHNEAVNLACEHIGIERTRSDAFFDGNLGRNLAKIIPFNHPLSPLDLDEVRRELEARPEEDRSITVVCLGKELAADAWIEDWNRLRKGDKAVNRIEVIELRTDARYGKFFEHKPASAKVKITRRKGQIQVKIEDFISPTIIERLAQQSGVLKPQIEDWRAMVDCVMIDPAYDGEVFQVALSDVPEKKDDLVQGTYQLPASEGPTTVAVKIIDMLGEEVLVTESNP